MHTIGCEMSRPPRRRYPAAVAGTPGGNISWRNCLIGVIGGELLLLIVSNVALGITNAVFGIDGLRSSDGGIVGVATLVAVVAGGFLAGRLAGRFELYQGIIVGVGFIIIGAIFQFLVEASIVRTALATHSHYIVDLGPMSMGNLISGDFLALFGGSVGGLLARRR